MRVPEVEHIRQGSKRNSVQSRRSVISVKKDQTWFQLFVQRVHILSWIPSYGRSVAVADFIAGLTLGLTMIPQSIAYAALAGLPSQYGLYSGFLGSLIYVFFGSIKEVSIGPTSLMSLLTLQYTMDKPVEIVILLTFLVGIVELFMGIFKLGFVVDFISIPVTSAFTSATSLIIIASQLKGLLGIKYKSTSFADTIHQLYLHIDEVQWGDAILSLFCISFLLLLRRLKDLPITLNNKSMDERLKKGLWYISISRNALVVLITSTVAYNWISREEIPFLLSGKVEPGIPSFQWPPFSMEYQNTTVGFVDMCRELGSGIVVIPLVAVLANIAIAKSFSTGKMLDATQEMLALGLCNIFGSFFSSMPTCGAFTRSAVSQASGVKTPFAGLYTGLIIILALSLLTPFFTYIPRATLASILCCAVAFMIDFEIAKKLWYSNKKDLFSWTLCLASALLLGVEIGLLVGISLSAFHLLVLWARPKTVVKIKDMDGIQYIRIVPNAGLYFSGIDYLRQKVNVACQRADYQVPVCIDCSKFTGLDYTSARGLATIAADLGKNNQILILEHLDADLQKFIDVSEHEIIFCNREETLREVLTQQGIMNGMIPLMQHIRASIDLGYQVQPLLSVESESEQKRRDSSAERG